MLKRFQKNASIWKVKGKQVILNGFRAAGITEAVKKIRENPKSGLYPYWIDYGVDLVVLKKNTFVFETKLLLCYKLIFLCFLHLLNLHTCLRFALISDNLKSTGGNRVNFIEKEKQTFLDHVNFLRVNYFRVNFLE